MIVPTMLAEAVDKPDEVVLRTLSVQVDVIAGITAADHTGSVIDSIDALRLALSERPSWRGHTITAAPVPEREALIERRVGEGFTTAEIAAELNLSNRTITTFRRKVRERKGSELTTAGSCGISVVGRSGLTRDLVHACVSKGRGDVNPAGVAYADDIVRVLVIPSQHDLALGGSPRVVVIGALPDGITILDAVRRGVIATGSISIAPDELRALVDNAWVGRAALSDDSVQALVDEIRRQDVTSLNLTARDRDIVEAIRLGESVKQTARRLGVSSKTVENRRQSLYTRFGVRSAQQLVRVVSDLV